MNHSEITKLRLHNQQISSSAFIKPEETLVWMGAIQGQDYNGAKWSIALRTLDCTEKDIERAMMDKLILRTWLFRGTLHLVSALDIRWMTSLISDRIIAACKRRYNELELDNKTLALSNDILTKALSETDSLNRKELLEILRNKGIETTGQRAAYILQRANLDGLIVQGNSLKNTPIYYSMDHILTKAIPTRDECLRDLSLRYFTSRGPATIADFGWWTGLPLKDIKIGLEACKHQLSSETLNGIEYYFKETEKKTKMHTIHLLPGFDEYLLGYKDRSSSLNAIHNTFWCPGNNGMFMPFITNNGSVIGLWKKVLMKKSLEIKSIIFDNIDHPDEKMLNQAIQQYCRYCNS